MVCFVWIFARNAPVTVRPKSIGEMVRMLARERLSWVLSAFYFLTFGGFVAFSIYLPSLLRDQFHLEPADAGFRTAGFVVMATLLRPVGGWLSDRIGGARVLSAVFSIVIPFALSARLAADAAIHNRRVRMRGNDGFGQWRCLQAGTRILSARNRHRDRTGGRNGGTWRLFPPLLLGRFRDRVGAVWPGYILLALVSLMIWLLNARVFIPRQDA